MHTGPGEIVEPAAPNQTESECDGADTERVAELPLAEPTEGATVIPFPLSW
jgi:hypothetical protein